MMKVRAVVVVILIAIVPAVGAQSEDEEFLYAFLEGSYEIIGRWPDSDEAYTGTMVFKRATDHLVTTRRMNGEIIDGVAKIETVGADSISVLRIRFVHDGRQYEGTYLIASDLDNYGRLSGYIYLKVGGTKIAGLEALFSTKGPPGQE